MDNRARGARARARTRRSSGEPWTDGRGSEPRLADDEGVRPRRRAVNGTTGTHFAHPVEEEIARIFDEHGIAWQYEPHTFVLERNGDGTVHEAFTPDFYLPQLGVYVECTVMRNALMARKRRKARKARGLGVSVEVLCRRDIETLASRWKLRRLARAAGARPGAAGRGAPGR